MAAGMGVESKPVDGAGVATGVGGETVAEGVTEGAAATVGDAGRTPTGGVEEADPQPANRMTAKRKVSQGVRAPARRCWSLGFMAWNHHPG